jgi:hypothetical protein
MGAKRALYCCDRKEERKMRMTLRSLAAVGGLLLGLALPAAADAYYAATEGAVSIRSGPGVGFKRLAVIPRGATLWVEFCQPRWCKAVWRGISGWVAASYVSGRGYVETQPYPDYGVFDEYYYDYYFYPGRPHRPHCKHGHCKPPHKPPYCDGPGKCKPPKWVKPWDGKPPKGDNKPWIGKAPKWEQRLERSPTLLKQNGPSPKWEPGWTKGDGGLRPRIDNDGPERGFNFGRSDHDDSIGLGRGDRRWDD